MPFVVSGQAGIDLTKTTTVPQHTLGTSVTTTDGGVFEYCKALSTISQYDAVLIDGNQAGVPITTTNAAEATGVSRVGVAQVSIASNSYGWIQRSGKMIVNVLANCNDFVNLFTTGTAGKLDDATISASLLLGIRTVASTTTASAVSAVAAAPLQVGWYSNPA